MKQHDLKQAGGGKRLFSFGLHFHIIGRNQDRNSKQGRNLEAGPDAEAMERCHLLACSPTPPSLFRLLSYRAQDYQPRDDPTQNGLGLPTSVTG